MLDRLKRLLLREAPKVGSRWVFHDPDPFKDGDWFVTITSVRDGYVQYAYDGFDGRSSTKISLFRLSFKEVK